MQELTPDSLLTRDKGAEALTERGYPTSRSALEVLASRGGGPVYRRYGKRVIYRWGDLLSWADNRCTIPRRSTAETDADNGMRTVLTQKSPPPPPPPSTGGGKR